jgi:multidrug efflux pump subunit AcrB
VFCRFFIDRPIFAAVISLLITLAGGLAFTILPIAQFPRITPPTITVSCSYPGASAKDVADAVAAPLEKEINGVEGMMYMSSSCTNDGSYNLTITFHQGTDPNVAQVLVQNRVALAINKLPDVIRATGVTTRKRSPDILMGVSLISPNGQYDQLYLSNFAVTKVRDELARLEGVGDVFIFGQQDYAMRIWLDPDRLAARGLTPSDVVRAIRDENQAVASGAIGPDGRREAAGVSSSAEHAASTEMTFPLSTLGRLTEVEQFENIVIRADEQGRVICVKDVARVELGARTLDTSARLDGKPTVTCAIFQRPDANALDTAERVKAKMRELEPSFPEGVAWEVGFDTTPYTRESIREVSKTLQEAIVLVALVVLLFLQNWRAAIIPLTAVPVAIVGTLAVMALLDFSLNNLTLFGLVLAIGIVVDDAIVVVEAVEHHIETGLSPREASIRAMEQVAGPVIAVGLVLSAVFVPCAFIKGITGLFFRQFALTIAVSTLISALNSLTLSPALCAILLPGKEQRLGSPFPWWASPLLGGVIGYVFGQDALSRRLPALSPISMAIVSAGIGMAAGLIVAWPMSRLMKRGFALFDRFVRGLTRRYVHTVRGVLVSGVPVTWVIVLTLGAGAGGMALRSHASEWWQTLQALAGRRGWAALSSLLASAPPETSWVLGAITAAAVFGLAYAILRRIPIFLAPRLGIGSWPKIPRVPTRGLALGVYVGLLLITWYGLMRTPRGFIPGQDMGYLMVTVQLPDAAATERTDDVMREMEQIVLQTPGVWHCTSIIGQSFALNATGPNFGSMFVRLLPYDQRRSPDLSSDAVLGRLMGAFSTIPDAMIQVIPPPPVRGVGRAGGFAFVVEDRGDLGPSVLEGQVENLLHQASQQSGLQRLFTSFRANVPQLHVQPNAAECAAKGVSVDDVNNTLRIYQGSLYVNDFNKFGRTWQVVVQADGRFRMSPEQVNRLKVRSQTGAMVPLGSLVDVKERNGPLVLTRYNMYPAAVINGSAAPGVSSRQAIDIMQNLAKRELPAAMAYEWTDMSYLELQAGNTALVLFAMGAVAVFLVLAAQYESWSLPLAVILVIPMCLLSGLIGVWLWRQDVNIFTQIGFVVLVGLASKNAILIVEFARARRHEGQSRLEATLHACQLRLRPIVMTSVAFILGVVPMLIGSGAGAEMRRALGTAVFSGMIGVTAFGLLLTPVFFYVIDWLTETRFGKRLHQFGDSCRSRGRRWFRLDRASSPPHPRVPVGTGDGT